MMSIIFSAQTTAYHGFRRGFVARRRRRILVGNEEFVALCSTIDIPDAIRYIQATHLGTATGTT
jgi:hypothetical protein